METAQPSDAVLLADLGFLRRLAWSLTRDDARADDLVQDATLLALESGGDEIRSPRAWFRRMMANLASNARRSAERRKRYESFAVEREAVLSPEQHAARREMLEAVITEVMRLDEPFATVVMMRFYDDLAPRDIAKRLKIAEGTARSRLSRGLAILRGRLDSRIGSRDRWATALAPAGLVGGTGIGVGMKAAAAVLVAVLLASVTMMALSSDAWKSRTRVEKQVAVPTPRTEDSKGPPGSPREDARSTRTETVLAAPRAAAPEGPSGASEDPEPAPIRGIVIDADDQTPIAGARISWLEPDLVPASHPARLAFWDEAAEKEILAGSQSVTSDSNGGFELPGTPGRILAIAARGDRWGMTKGGATALATITMAIDRSDWIEVRDREGQPRAAVPVVVKRLGGPVEMIVWRGVTGADGKAEIRHAQRLRPRAQRVGLTYGLDLFGSRAVEEKVLEGPARVQLELPPTAALRVLVRKPDQTPFGTGARVALRGRNAPSEGGSGELIATTDASGWATFPYVAAKADLVVLASDPAGRFRGAPEIVVTSSDAGGSIDVVATFAERARALVLRAVDESGKPLANRAILRATAGAPECFGTNADGLVRIPLAHETSVDLLTLTVSRVLSLGARVAVSAPKDGPEDLEVGDVTLKPLPILASGRVKSTGSIPAAGVNVWAARESRSRPGSPPIWATDPVLAARAASDGRFVLRGLPGGTPLRLDAVPSSSPTDGVRCEEGATDVEIVLSGGRTRARISGTRGSIVVDADVPLEILRASLRRRPEPGAQVAFGPVTTPLQELPSGGSAEGKKAEFVFPSLEPGTYEFTLESVGGGDPVTTTTIQTAKATTTFGSFGGFEGGVAVFDGPEIQILEGRPPDGRLENLDAKKRLRVVRAVATDSDGKPVVGAEATILSSDSPAKKMGGGTTDAAGRVMIVTTPGSHRLAIRALGHRTALVPLGAGEPAVVLRSGIPVRLVLRAAPGAKPASNGWVRIERSSDPSSKLAFLTDEDTAIARLPDDGRVRLVDGAATLRIPAPGSYRVALLSPSETPAADAPVVSYRALASQVITVTDSDGEQTFEIVQGD